MRRDRNNVSWVDGVIFILLAIVIVPIKVLGKLIKSK